MQSESKKQVDPPKQHASRSRIPRRSFLHMSGVGITAGMIGGATGYVMGSSNQARSDVGRWTAASIPSQQGRRILVTGGNGFPQDGRSGLGYHDALGLARAGADVTIASRNLARGEEAVRRIRADAPDSSVRFEPLDLADLASVSAFCARLRASGRGLDVLINNAGVMGRAEREVSADGFERVFATNTLGHFALTAELLPLLRNGRDPRIVWVASLRVSEALDFNDLQLEQVYDYAAAYDNSKLANLMLAFEFSRRSDAFGWGVASVAAHPGVARTNLIPDGPGLDSREGWRFRWLPFLFQDPAQGALPTLYAATNRDVRNGGYYGPDGLGGIRGYPAEAQPPHQALDTAAAGRLWEVSTELTGRAVG